MNGDFKIVILANKLKIEFIKGLERLSETAQYIYSLALDCTVYKGTLLDGDSLKRSQEIMESDKQLFISSVTELVNAGYIKCEVEGQVIGC